MENCIFCSIIAENDPNKIVWQNDAVAAFNSVPKSAPVHVLVVSKEHLKSLDELEDSELANQLLLAARSVAREAGVEGAWQLRANNGAKVGQTIEHLHLHVLGGKEMAE